MADAGGAKPQMITWDSVRRELNCARNDEGPIDYDGMMGRKLAALEAHAKRPIILYATDFLNESKMRFAANASNISHEDVRGLAEVVRGLEGDNVDLILHSPGGSPEAAESIVAVLRGQFKKVRVLVPVMAKSAATMIALAADEVLMPRSAELGPTDPQFILNDGRGGQRVTPAQAIIDEVRRAIQAVNNNSADKTVWLTQVQGQPAGLYQQAINAVQLSKQLVSGRLQQDMLAGDGEAAQKAQAIVDYLGDHNRFLTHARRVDIDSLARPGAKVSDVCSVGRQLRQPLEELWYTVEHMFRGTPAVKVWENSRGVGLFMMMQQGPMPGARN